MTTAPPGTLPRPEAPSRATRGIRVVFCRRLRLSRRLSHRHPCRLRWRRQRRDHDPTPAPPCPGVESSDHRRGGHLPPHVVVVVVVVVVIVEEEKWVNDDRPTLLSRRPPRPLGHSCAPRLPPARRGASVLSFALDDGDEADSDGDALSSSSSSPPSAGATNRAGGGGRPETLTTSKSATPSSPKPLPPVRPPEQGSR